MTLDYHAERQFLLDRVFQFHPAVVEYAQLLHDNALQDRPLETVSVHFRLGGADEPENFAKGAFGTFRPEASGS